jgi:hypothetical protein
MRPLRGIDDIMALELLKRSDMAKDQTTWEKAEFCFVTVFGRFEKEKSMQMQHISTSHSRRTRFSKQKKERGWWEGSQRFKPKLEETMHG